MRSHALPLQHNETAAIFVRDEYPGGGTVIECERCHHEQTEPFLAIVVETKCAGCGRFFVYRPWCEW